MYVCVYMICIFVSLVCSVLWIYTDRFDSRDAEAKRREKNRHFFHNIYQAAETTDMPKSCK